MKPRILDFDGGVLPLADEQRIALADWQERIRFGCSGATLNGLDAVIGSLADPARDTVFLGSGDYHHLSYLLIRRHAALRRPLQVVLFDNHPDNMRYPFGIHCGSWVWHVSRLPFVSQIHVLGITSSDVEAAHSWENHLRNLRSGKVRYWCVGRDLGWMRTFGITQSRSFASSAAMLEAFSVEILHSRDPVYLTIDKDVLSPEDARTNWDQGVMRIEELGSMVTLIRDRVVGSDVTGEVSVYRYHSRFKRLLSGLDGQPDLEASDLARWQAGHRDINLQILRWLGD